VLDYFVGSVCFDDLFYIFFHFQFFQFQRLNKPGQGAMTCAYGRIVRKVLNDAPYTFLIHREQGYAYKVSVQGFRSLPGLLSFCTGDAPEFVTVTS